MSEVIARRQFSPGYIGFDIAFLLVFAGLLLWRKKYMTVLSRGDIFSSEKQRQ